MTKDLHHLAAAYALKALDAEERAAFAAHYPTCDVCSAEVRDFAATAVLLGEGADTPAPVRLRSSVLAEIQNVRQISPLPPETVIDLDAEDGSEIDLTDQKPSRRRIRSTPRTFFALAAGILAIVGSMAIVGARQPSEFSTLAMGDDVVLTSLHSPENPDPDDSIDVVWSPVNNRVGLTSDDLPELESGQTYELWFFEADGAIVPAAVFDTRGIDKGIVLNVLSAEPAGWGVTIEPSGGSAQPTSPVIYAAEI